MLKSFALWFINMQFQIEWDSFKQDPKKTAVIFLKLQSVSMSIDSRLAIVIDRKHFIKYCFVSLVSRLRKTMADLQMKDCF